MKKLQMLLLKPSDQHTGSEPKSLTATTAATEEPPKHRLIGIAWCFFHIFLLATASTLVKFVDVPAEEKLFIRCCLQFTLLLPVVEHQKRRHQLRVFFIPRATLKALFLRGTVGPLGALCLYQALDRIALGDAIAITFTNSVFAGVLGKIFLHEDYTKFDIICTAVSLGGVVLIAKPAFLFGTGGATYGLYELSGIGLALLNAFAVAACLILIRSLGKSSPILNVFYFSWCGVFISGAFMYGLGNFYLPCQTDLLLILLLGLSSVGSQLAVTKALQYERASFVAVIRSLQLVLVFVYQVRLALAFISLLF